MNSELPDKQYLYGRYMDAEDWRQKLHKKLTHKSLDIPEDDDVHVDNSKTGLGWKELAVLGATIVAASGIYIFSPSSKDTQTPVQPPAQQSPIDSEYEVLFYDKDGNQITVPHISTKPK